MDSSKQEYLNSAFDWCEQSEEHDVKYVAKLRVCCPDEFTHTLTEPKRYEDFFYDNVGHGYGEIGKFCRLRFSFQHDSDHFHLLQSSDNSGNIDHIYTHQVKLSSLPPDVDHFLLYKFERIYLDENSEYELYIDTVISPVKYRVMTMKFVLEKECFDQRKVNFSKICDRMKWLDKFWIQNKLPLLYSKFSFMLQVSAKAPIYRNIFSYCNGNDDEAREQMVVNILDERQEIVNGCWIFIWAFHAIQHFENLCTLRNYSIEKSQQLLNEEWEEMMKPENRYRSNCEIDCI